MLTYTENGALTHTTTGNAIYDLFALGASMRNRSNEDIIELWEKAFNENPTYAVKCLFFIRDAMGEGLGERRFFRTLIKHMANSANLWERASISRNMDKIPEFGRWDDLYSFVGTKLESQAFDIIKNQLTLDMSSEYPSLCAKWLASEQASSQETKRLAELTRKYLGFSERGYRKVLSNLRKRLNVIERLMSNGEWDKIEFDKIPSKAGLNYRKAFERHCGERYEEFINNNDTKVNAGALYPYDVVRKAINYGPYYPETDNSVDRNAINKYWDNLTDYFKERPFNALAVVDTSGSMCSHYFSKTAPIDVAVSLGLYCAERAQGPFRNHYISFSRRARLIKCEGRDFVEKVQKIYSANLCENTNIESVFDLILNTAIENNLPQSAMPEHIVIISDMEFDDAQGFGPIGQTVMERIKLNWETKGYVMPKLVFWNVDARQNNIPMKSNGLITFVSGCSPVIFDMVLSGKTGYDLCFEKLNSERYATIY